MRERSEIFHFSRGLPYKGGGGQFSRGRSIPLYILQISVSNKSKSVSNESISHKIISDESMANPKCTD